MGIAALVLQAQVIRQEVTDTSLAAAPSAAATPRTGGKPPTAKQQGLLQDLLRERGVPEEDITAQLAQVTTSWEASARIDHLRSQLRQREA